MARKVKVPVYVKMGAQLEGPITMSVEEGPALYEPRSRDMYAIRDPPIVIQRGGRRRIGYVVSRESAQTLAFDEVSGTFAPAPDPSFLWPPWIRSAQTVRGQNAQADGADYALWMKVMLGFAGFALGVVLVFIINSFSGGCHILSVAEWWRRFSSRREAGPRRPAPESDGGSRARSDVELPTSGDGGSGPASDAQAGGAASLLERGTPRRSVMVRDGRYPVLVQRGGVLEGPVTMRLKNGQLHYGKTGESFVVDEAPVILKRKSKRQLGFVVAASVTRTVRWETPRALCAFQDGSYEVTPDFISSKLDTRAILAMGLAVKRPWTVLFALLGGGAGVGFFVVAVIGIGTSTISSMLSRGG